MTDARHLSRRRFGGGAIVAAALTVGCGPIRLTPEPPQLYQLSPKSTFDEDLPKVVWQILIEPPVAAAGLDTARIALRQSVTTLDYYADVSWTDRAPEMVQTLMVESFENSGQIVSVGRESIGLRANYVLKTELREFQTETFGGGPYQVRVRLNAKLVRIPDRVIIAGENFESLNSVSEQNFGAVIHVFDEGLGKVLRRLVEWTLREGEADWRAQQRNRPA
ncbi:MAG: ABC-type transport auxiliary lipoprotein family protein [Inquilinaceae bacterium]